MAAEQEAERDHHACPNCGADVVYKGVGRRPVWCSTRCRNDASLKRLGARRAAVEVRVIEVPRHRDGGNEHRPDGAFRQPGSDASNGPGCRVKPSTPTAEQALRALRNDPEAVGKLLSHLERRRVEGRLSEPEWLPVRNALRLIASALPAGIERPQ